LSILDLSSAGHQPMISASGRYVVVFNGEIYNHLELRRQLTSAVPFREGRKGPWRGHSDTETLLAAVEAWGLEGSLQTVTGMFAFALWDREARELHLARDRLGEKPLYYGWHKGGFFFGSELKALKAYPGFSGEIARNALALFLRHNYIPAPYAVYRGLYKLPPASVLTLRRKAANRCPWPEEQPPLQAFDSEGVRLWRYWSLRERAELGQADISQLSEAEMVDALDELLRDAVRRQMIADVPLGAFLSGGIDSSTVVALMQAQHARPVKTFSIGFRETGYDEAVYARAVAKHLGTEHTELYISPEQALAVIPNLSSIYDEPFADSSQIPTFLVSQLARRDVSIGLSGDGGDELFGGYNRYFWAAKTWRRIGRLPRPLRGAMANGIGGLSPTAWNRLWKRLEVVLPRQWRYANPGDKLHKFAEVLTANEAEEIYRNLVSHWKSPAEIVRGAAEPATVLTGFHQRLDMPDFEHRMMYLDLMSYMPDDLLVKVDRAAMAVSLETRVPFLDHRVVEFAWRLPLSVKIRNGQGKWLLRQVLYRYLPKELIERPKMGFGIPLDIWLRGPLRDWAEELIGEARLQRDGFFEPAPIREKWAEHLAGRRNWSYHLWDVLMFQAWLEAS